MKNIPKDFFETYTDFQCFILANMNRGNINGVTATHYNIIEYIYRNDKPTGKALAKAFNVSQAAISKQLKFLIENQLIVQEQDEKDRRVFYLLTTEKGKFIIDNSEDFRKKVAEQFQTVFSADEFETFTELLQKFVRSLN